MKTPVDLLMAAFSTTLLCCNFDGHAAVKTMVQGNDTTGTDTNLSYTRSMELPGFPRYKAFKEARTRTGVYSYTSIYQKAERLKQLAIAGGNDINYGILVDMGIDESSKRLFVVDLTTNTIIKYGIVGAHKGQPADLLGVYQTGVQLQPMSYALQPVQITKKQPAQTRMELRSSDVISDDGIAFNMASFNGGLNISRIFFSEISQLLQQAGKPIMIWVYR